MPIQDPASIFAIDQGAESPVRSSELLAGCLSVPPDNLGESESQPSKDYQ